MANTKLLEREIHNYQGGRARRSQLPFGLIYQTPPEQLEKATSLAKAAVESRKGCTFVRCAILGFGASSIDFELIFDSRTTDANKVAADRTAVALAVLRSFAEHNLEFAYPTQTTFTAAPDGTMIMPYATPGR
jgi:small-conductance mechanosensitive channel